MDDLSVDEGDEIEILEVFDVVAMSEMEQDEYSINEWQKQIELDLWKRSRLRTRRPQTVPIWHWLYLSDDDEESDDDVPPLVLPRPQLQVRTVNTRRMFTAIDNLARRVREGALPGNNAPSFYTFSLEDSSEEEEEVSFAIPQSLESIIASINNISLSSPNRTELAPVDHSVLDHYRDEYRPEWISDIHGVFYDSDDDDDDVIPHSEEDDEDWIDDIIPHTDTEDEKETRRELYERHSSRHRFNYKESRRREYKIRKRLRHRSKLCKVVPRSDVAPHAQDGWILRCGYPTRPLIQRRYPGQVEVHADDDDEEDCWSDVEDDEEDDIVTEEQSSTEKFYANRKKRRNAMAHAVADVKAASRDDDDGELSKLLSTVSSLESFAEGADQIAQIDEWMGHLENLLILAYHMKKAQSFMDIFVAVVAYAKMYTKDKSIILDLYRLINEVTDTCDTPEEESEDVDPHGWETLSGEDVIMHWELFKTNTIFKKISYLISAAMSLTVCTTKQIEWSPFGLKLISIEAAKEQLAAVDVIDALVRTFVWMCQTGYEVFQQKSLAPLLYSDKKTQQYNEDYDYVFAHAETAIAGNLADLGDYEKKLNSVYKRTCAMKAVKNHGPPGVWLQAKYVALVGILERLNAKRKNTDIRFNPLGWSLYGSTGVGKTTLGKLTMLQSLAAMGFCDDEGRVDESRIITKDMFDKYDSTWTSDILGVFMDDLNNTRSEFQKDNPHTAVIIKFFNNVAAQAVKAELNAKGIVFIDFKCGIVTSNDKYLGAREFSNCPESILRRFYTVTVKVKEQYRKKGTLMLDTEHPQLTSSTSLVQDVWELTVEDVITWERGPEKVDFAFQIMDVVLDDGSTIHCKDLGLKDYLRVVIQLSKNHRKAQDGLLERSKNMKDTKFCTRCFNFPEYCCCSSFVKKCQNKSKDASSVEDLGKNEITEQEVDPHAMDLIVNVAQSALSTAFRNYVNSWTRPVEILNSLLGYSPIRKMATSKIAKELEMEMNNTATPLLVAITPDWLFRTTTFQRSVAAWQRAAAYYDVRRPLRLGVLAGLGTVASSLLLLRGRNRYAGAAVGSFATWFTTLYSYCIYQKRFAILQSEYIKKRDALPEYAKAIRDGGLPKSVLFVATIAVGAKLISMWNKQRIEAMPQALSPEDVDSQPGWFGYMAKKIGWTVASTVSGAIPDHVLATGEKNLGWCEFTRADGSTTRCNIVYPEKGYVWFPRHIFFPQSDMTKEPVSFVRGEVYRSSDKKTSKFKFIAQLDVNAVTIPEIDMVECFVERCPDIRNNVKKFLPTAPMQGLSVCTIMMRDKNVEIQHEKVTVQHGAFGHKYLSMEGGNYTTSNASTGSCMAMLVCEGTTPVIAGFHIGGNSKKKYGVMMSVTQSQAEQLRKKLLDLPRVKGLATPTEIPKEQYNIPILASSDVHPNAHFIRNLTDEAAIDVLGSTKVRAKAKSKVVPSVLECEARKLFDINKEYGPPQMEPNWRAFNETLKYIVDPAEAFEPALLKRAADDWIAPVLVFAREYKRQETFRPLSFKEAIMGIPGKRFVDAMPIDTSIGFPVFGPKSRMFTDVMEGEVLVNRVPDEKIVQEYNRCMTCWKNNTRAYPVISATLKDTPTEKGVSKVRVFQAAPVALSIAIRQYFLPIARFLSLCPLTSEVAVGINAFSPQWEELMAYAEKFASDGRVLALDHSKYDVRMNSQITYTVWQLFIEIAKELDYPADALAIMSTMVTDIIHPLLDYNGTLMMAYNMNTSGNNMTVDVNCVANSLYIRMGFFSACPEVKDFRSAVAITTYGDDLKGSVELGFRSRFNFHVLKEFLAAHGMKITEPSKSDEAHDDMDVEDADFLKRKSNYIPEIGVSIGALDKESMLRPFLANLKSANVTPNMVAISCVETYAHELFAHGREEYEHDQQLLREMCKNALEFVPPAVDYTFDERVRMWKDKYL